MQYLFTILNGPARGRRFAVDASRAIILGRGDDADVQLTDDEYVSSGITFKSHFATPVRG